MNRTLCLLALTCVALAPAQSTPPAGSPLRKAILDGLRPRVEKDLNQKVLFQVDSLKVQGDWAFMVGRPLRPNGKRIDFAKTRYAEAVQAGVFDEGFAALLRFKAKRWEVVRYSLGHTDVPWVEWPKQTGAPAKLFPGTGG